MSETGEQRPLTRRELRLREMLASDTRQAIGQELNTGNIPLPEPAKETSTANQSARGAAAATAATVPPRANLPRSVTESSSAAARQAAIRTEGSRPGVAPQRPRINRGAFFAQEDPSGVDRTATVTPFFDDISDFNEADAQVLAQEQYQRELARAVQDATAQRAELDAAARRAAEASAQASAQAAARAAAAQEAAVFTGEPTQPFSLADLQELQQTRDSRAQSTQTQAAQTQAAPRYDAPTGALRPSAVSADDDVDTVTIPAYQLKQAAEAAAKAQQAERALKDALAEQQSESYSFPDIQPLEKEKSVFDDQARWEAENSPLADPLTNVAPFSAEFSGTDADADAGDAAVSAADLFAAAISQAPEQSVRTPFSQLLEDAQLENDELEDAGIEEIVTAEVVTAEFEGGQAKGAGIGNGGYNGLDSDSGAGFSFNFDDVIEDVIAREETQVHNGTAALILPAFPDQELSGPLGATGELFITGSLELPKTLSETGGHASQLDRETDDSKDHLDIFSEFESSKIDVAPKSASRAVSAKTTQDGVATTPETKADNKKIITYGLIGGGLILALSAAGFILFTSGLLG